LRIVGGWRVAVGLETLSDHRYIELSLASHRTPTKGRVRQGRRWSLGKLDEDLLMASVRASMWALGDDRCEWENLEVEGIVSRLRGIIWEACDASMPRAGKGCARRAAY